MEQINLSEGSEVPFLREETVLPAVEQQNLQGYVPFPHQSDALLDLSLFRQPVQIPRFSLFRGSNLHLNGFRLLHRDGICFTDDSLVSEHPQATASFRQKMLSGQAEDVEAAFLTEPDPGEISVDAEVLLLASDEPSNFGSWIYRFLPKLLLSDFGGEPLPIFCYWNSWIDRILRFAAPDREVIHQNPRLRYRLARATVPSLPAPHVLFRGEIIKAFHALAERAPAPPAGMEKIYVSRRKQSLARIGHRVFEGETQLVEMLAEQGFREFFPEDHSFEMQIAIFAAARVIVGCGGSNMFGCVFSRAAELIVDIESSTDWAFAHSNLLSSVPAAYSMVRGVPTSRGNSYHRNWTLDIDLFIDGLRGLTNS